MLVPEAQLLPSKAGTWAQELPSSWLMYLALLEQPEHACLLELPHLSFALSVTHFLSPSSTLSPPPQLPAYYLKTTRGSAKKKKKHFSDIPISNDLVVGSERSSQDKTQQKT